MTLNKRKHTHTHTLCVFPSRTYRFQNEAGKTAGFRKASTINFRIRLYIGALFLRSLPAVDIKKKKNLENRLEGVCCQASTP